MAGADTTADDILRGFDLRGRRYLVTGASGGLGAETVRALLACGADVVGTVRDVKKARESFAPAKPEGEAGHLDFVQLDLSSLAKVRACAMDLLSVGRPFDAIIANAGVLAMPGKTAEGFEPHFGTNHLGHFVLVNRLASLLKSGSRVVILSASGHSMADVDLEDLNYERQPYFEILAYDRSKTANILFAVEFDRRHMAKGIRAAAVHPGVVSTDLGRYLSQEIGDQLVQLLRDRYGVDALPWQFKTIEQGAATVVWAAVAAPSDEIGGRYCEDCQVANVVSDPLAVNGVQSYAVDPARARLLWDKSEKLVGEHF